MDLHGKNVVVVGGFGGIGFETCKALLKKQIANLAIFDIQENSSDLAALKQEFPQTKCIKFLKMDITKRSDIENCFENIIDEFKSIDILINCSGIGNEAKPELLININLTGLINTCLVAFEYMSKEKGGKGGVIVNVASVVGLEPASLTPIYGASKHGVVGFTRSLGSDFVYNLTGVKCIVICPGFTSTDLIQNIVGSTMFSSTKALSHAFESSRKQTPQDCAVNLVKAIEADKNGSIWICDLGQLREITPTEYWKHENI